MNSDIENLLVLQDRDTRIRALEADIKRIPLETSAAGKRLTEKTQQWEAAKDEVTRCELAIRRIEGDVETRRQTIARLQVQRFETRKNEEYQAIGREIEDYGAEISKLEDSELETMEELERAQLLLSEAARELETCRKSVEADQADFASRRTRDEEEIAALREERTRLGQAIDPGILSLYERIAQRKFPAVVPVTEQGTCGGCHMKLTPGNLDAAMAGSKAVQCDHCGRLLHSA